MPVVPGGLPVHRPGVQEPAPSPEPRGWLANRVAAVDGQCVAGDHRGGVAEQECDRPGDVVGFPESSYGDSGQQLGSQSGLLRVDAVSSVRTKVGATALTRIPAGAHSRARILVR